MRFKTLLQENVQLGEVDSPDELEGITDVVDVVRYVNLCYKKLKTIPVKFGKVGGHFYCNSNQLTSLVGIHKLIKKIDGRFNISFNPIREGGIGLLLIDGLKEIKSNHPALDIINKYVSRGKMGILACQEELIEAGYEEFAKL